MKAKIFLFKAFTLSVLITSCGVENPDDRVKVDSGVKAEYWACDYGEPDSLHGKYEIEIINDSIVVEYTFGSWKDKFTSPYELNLLGDVYSLTPPPGQHQEPFSFVIQKGVFLYYNPESDVYNSYCLVSDSLPTKYFEPKLEATNPDTEPFTNNVPQLITKEKNGNIDLVLVSKTDKKKVAEFLKNNTEYEIIEENNNQ
jgi:hypothetical protein